MINEAINNNLKEIRKMVDPEEMIEHINFLDKFIDKDIDYASLKELAIEFSTCGMFYSFYHRNKEKLRKKFKNIDETMGRLCKQLFEQKCVFEAEIDFVKNEETGEYELTYFGVKTTSFSNSKNVKDYIHKLVRCYTAIQEYSKKQISQVVATNLYKSEEFNKYFNDVSRFSLIKNMNIPHIKVNTENSGVLIFENHNIKKDYIFSIEFTDVFKTFGNVSIMKKEQ